MFKFFVGLAIGVVGGAAITVKVASQNPHIKRAVGDAVAEKMLDFIYGPRPEPVDHSEARQRLRQNRRVPYDKI